MLAFPVSNSALSDTETTNATFTAANCFTDCEEVVEEENSHDPGVRLYANDQNNEVGFVLNNVSDFDSFEYRLKYEHDPGITEMVQGVIDNASGHGSLIEEWIVLGFCSNSVCTYHQGIEKVELEVDLIKAGGVESTVQTSINI